MKKDQKKFEYEVKPPKAPSKRICLAVDLKNDPNLIAQYKEYHKPDKIWPEIVDGIKKAGILVMDIYHVDDRLFMICEIPPEADLDETFEKMVSFPRQDAWASLMANYQQALPGHRLEWVKMERVFTLPED